MYGLKVGIYKGLSAIYSFAMAEYTIEIDGYESGLTTKTVEQMFREQYGDMDVEITVTESG